jgi:hypothetical protein
MALSRVPRASPETVFGSAAEQRLQLQQQDPLGYAVPLGAHIRRMNLRDIAANLNRRRMIRRGATYGSPLPGAAPVQTTRSARLARRRIYALRDFPSCFCLLVSVRIIARDAYEHESSDPLENNPLRCASANSLCRHLDWARSSTIPEQLESGHITVER